MLNVDADGLSLTEKRLKVMKDKTHILTKKEIEAQQKFTITVQSLTSVVEEKNNMSTSNDAGYQEAPRTGGTWKADETTTAEKAGENEEIGTALGTKSMEANLEKKKHQPTLSTKWREPMQHIIWNES